MTKKTKDPAVVVPVEKKVAEISKDLVSFDKKQNNIATISDDKGLGLANEFLIEVKGRVNRIKALKTEYIKPIKDSIKHLEELFNEPLKNYEEIEKVVKRGMGDYRLAEDEKARVEEAKLKVIRDKEVAKAEKKGDPAPVIPTAIIPKKETMLESKSGGKSSASKIVKFEVEDADDIPKKYKDLVYDLAVKKGLLDTVLRPVVKLEGMKTKIKGVRVYEDYQISAQA